jgi:hypothetical protein
VVLKLSSKGVALLRKLKRLLAKATVTVSYGSLAPVSSTRTVTLKMPRKGKPSR